MKHMLILTVNVAIYALVCKLCTHGPYGLLYFEIKLYSIPLIIKVYAGKRIFGKSVKINTDNTYPNFNEQ